MAVLLLIAPAVFAREARVDEFRNATPAELTMTSVPFAAGAPAVVLDWVQWRDDVDGKESEYVRIKILSEEGKKYGDVEITYIPLISNIDRLEARTTKPDGTIVPFTGKPYEKVVVKAGGVRVISKTFTLPAIQVGSIIEYRYVLGTRSTALGFVTSAKFTVMRELPVMREVIGLRPYGGFQNFFTYRGLPPGKKPEMNGNHYELTLEDIPSYREEQFTPPVAEVKPMVNFYYTDSSPNPDAFWKEEGKSLTTAIEDFISGDPTPIHNAAADAVKDAQTPEEKLRRIYATTQKIRNLTYEEEKSAAEEKKLKDNNSAQDVLRNGYGYSREIGRLFVALARSAGLEANIVRIATRAEEFFSKKLPVGSQLNSEVVLVKLDGKDVVLDPGTPNAPFGVVAWEKGHVPGLKIVKKQEATWYETPDLQSQDAVVDRKATLHLDGDVVKGKIVVTYVKQEALSRRLINHTDDEAQTKKALEDVMKEHVADGATIKLTKVTGMKTADPEVVAEYDVELPNGVSSTGSRMIVPLSIFRAKETNPFAPADRRAPVYFDYPSIEEDEVTFEMPAGYMVETLPNNTDLDAGAITFSAHYEAKDNTLQFKRRMAINSMFFGRELYTPIRNVFSKIQSADQEQALLKRAK